MNLQLSRCLAPVSQCWRMNLNSTMLGQCWLPNAGSRWLLFVEEDGQNPRRLRRCSSSHSQGWSCFPGREIDRRVLTADNDAEVGLITCEWSGVGQRARLSIPERSRARCWSDSSQRRWSRCPGRWKVSNRRKKSLEHPGVTWRADEMLQRMRAGFVLHVHLEPHARMCM